MTPPPTGDGNAAELLEQTQALWLDGSTDDGNRRRFINDNDAGRTPAAPTRAAAAEQVLLSLQLQQMPWILLYPAIDYIWQTNMETASKALAPWPRNNRLGRALYPNEDT
jgi:hypothetical protein